MSFSFEKFGVFDPISNRDILAMEYDSDLQTIATRPGDPKPDCQLYEAVRLCDLLRRGTSKCMQKLRLLLFRKSFHIGIVILSMEC